MENNSDSAAEILSSLDQDAIDKVLVLGITGPPGAGKSTLTSTMIHILRKEKNEWALSLWIHRPP